jgi:hypothetical protein
MGVIKGQWYADRNENSVAPDEGIRDRVYATQPNGEKFIVAKVFSDEEGDYNSTSQLIAAAPELLAACKYALSYFHQTRSGVDWRDAGGEEPEILAAAIAKAEGGGNELG